jgi:hypothetical protein
MEDDRCQPNSTLLIVAFVFSILTALAIVIQVGFGQQPVIYPILLAFFPIALAIHNTDFAKQVFDVICPSVAQKAVFVTSVVLIATITTLLPFTGFAARYAIIALVVCSIGLMTAAFLLQRMGKLKGDAGKCRILFDYDEDKKRVTQNSIKPVFVEKK